MKRVLVADDEPHIRRVVELTLQELKCDAVLVGDGEEAWRSMQEQSPDLLISDVNMPVLDGLRLTQRIRLSPQYFDLPVVLLTSKALELTQSHPDLMTTCDLIAKPFSPKALYKHLKQLLSGTEILTPEALEDTDAAQGPAPRESRERACQE